MSRGPESRPNEAAGLYRTDAGEWGVTLRQVGEGYEVVALKARSGVPLACATERDALAAMFTAPRAGADRYPDWADFEWRTRLGFARPDFDRVWRIAEDRRRVAFLGLAVRGGGADWPLPVAAALWRGWCRTPGLDPRALFWNSSAGGHLWLVHPFELPRYVGLGPMPAPEAVVCALTSMTRPERLVLEAGGLPYDYWVELERLFPGELRSVEPFADLMVASDVRDRLSSHSDPTVYLPALGAALALLQGAPPVHRLCESSPEAGAVDG
jgi:hypothetical protein